MPPRMSHSLVQPALLLPGNYLSAGNEQMPFHGLSTVPAGVMTHLRPDAYPMCSSRPICPDIAQPHLLNEAKLVIKHEAADGVLTLHVLVCWLRLRFENFIDSRAGHRCHACRVAVSFTHLNGQIIQSVYDTVHAERADVANWLPMACWPRLMNQT